MIKYIKHQFILYVHASVHVRKGWAKTQLALAMTPSTSIVLMFVHLVAKKIDFKHYRTYKYQL